MRLTGLALAASLLAAPPAGLAADGEPRPAAQAAPLVMRTATRTLTLSPAASARAHVVAARTAPTAPTARMVPTAPTAPTARMVPTGPTTSAGAVAPVRATVALSQRTAASAGGDRDGSRHDGRDDRRGGWHGRGLFEGRSWSDDDWRHGRSWYPSPAPTPLPAVIVNRDGTVIVVGGGGAGCACRRSDRCRHRR
jgi:hypothetical protein